MNNMNISDSKITSMLSANNVFLSKMATFPLIKEIGSAGDRDRSRNRIHTK